MYILRCKNRGHLFLWLLLTEVSRLALMHKVHLFSLEIEIFNFQRELQHFIRAHVIDYSTVNTLTASQVKSSSLLQ